MQPEVPCFACAKLEGMDAFPTIRLPQVQDVLAGGDGGEGDRRRFVNHGVVW